MGEDNEFGNGKYTEDGHRDRRLARHRSRSREGLSGSRLQVVANSRNITKSGAFEASDKLALVDGSIAEAATAAKIAEVAKSKFGSIDALVNNAGIYFSKPFTDYTIDDLRSLVSVNIEGFLFISQLAIKQMLAQKTGGSIVNITSTMVDHPIAGINSAVPMITKGGLEAVTRSLAMEYAKQGIRVNAVAPGIVDTPMHKDNPEGFSQDAATDGTDFQRERHRGRDRLSDGSRSGDRGGAARGRRCARWQMVTREGSRPASAEQRLEQLGIKLPTAPEPFGTYVEAVQTGNLLFLTGMLPTEGRVAKFIGRVGAELDVEMGQKAAHLAALNALAVTRRHLGSLDKVTRVVRLGVSVATSGDVRDQPKIADAASELLQDVFGKEKNPSRLVFGVASLPLGTPVELEVIFEVTAQEAP